MTLQMKKLPKHLGINPLMFFAIRLDMSKFAEALFFVFLIAANPKIPAVPRIAGMAGKRQLEMAKKRTTSKKQATDQTAEWQRLATKQGDAVRRTFLRIIARATGCGDVEAARVFEKAVKEKTIIQTGFCGGSPGEPKYKMQ